MSESPYAGNQEAAAEFARKLLETEVATQMKMWGDVNRVDGANGELMRAAMTSLDLVFLKTEGKLESHTAEKIARSDFYPENWQPNAFRDYGTRIANLVVAGAFIQNEIVRCLVNGEDWTRAPRPVEKSYTGTQPAMSSAEARGDAV